MTRFRVHQCYYQAARDLIVLAGEVQGGLIFPGSTIDLPVSIRGPGHVPIKDVSTVTFADGDRLCVVLDYAVVADAPLLEFTDLVGKDLDVQAPEGMQVH